MGLFSYSSPDASSPNLTSFQCPKFKSVLYLIDDYVYVSRVATFTSLRYLKLKSNGSNLESPPTICLYSFADLLFLLIVIFILTVADPFRAYTTSHSTAIAD